MPFCWYDTVFQGFLESSKPQGQTYKHISWWESQVLDGFKILHRRNWDMRAFISSPDLCQSTGTSNSFRNCKKKKKSYAERVITMAIKLLFGLWYNEIICPGACEVNRDCNAYLCIVSCTAEKATLCRNSCVYVYRWTQFKNRICP